MASSSKRKGNRYEAELVTNALDFGLPAVRAWGSNGQALGEAPEVDLTVAGARLQAKRRKAIPAWLQIPDGADAVAVRADRSETLVLLTWSDFLRLLRDADGW